MEIKVTRGPLDSELLGAVARLYGSYDSKYGSIDFCRVIFNDNPSGYSFHSFAYDDGRIVGHCATIPMEIFARGRTELSAKAEALFVDDDHRSRLVKEGNLEVPTGVAIAAYLYKSTLEDPTIRVVHGICDDVIGLVHRMAGCRRRTARQTRYMCIVSPGFVSRSGGDPVRKLSLWAAFVVQQALSLLVRAALLVSLKLSSCRHMKGDSGQPIDFLTAVPDELGNGGRWTLARSAANFTWFFRTGLLETVATGDPLRQCAVIKRNAQPGHDLEIVDFKSVGGGVLDSLAILSAVTVRARATGAGRVVFSNLALRGDGQLERASTLLGFWRRKEEALIFLKSMDSFYTKKDSMQFTPLLHSVF